MNAIEWIVWRTFKPVPKRFVSKLTPRDLADSAAASDRAHAIRDWLLEHGEATYPEIAVEFDVAGRTAERFVADARALGLVAVRKAGLRALVRAI